MSPLGAGFTVFEIIGNELGSKTFSMLAHQPPPRSRR
jgi:hypothetical protein